MGPPTPLDVTHQCPGGCKRRVSDRLFACGDDWARLPYPYQRAISSTYQRDGQAHAEAMLRAVAWYDANPPVRTREDDS